MTNFRIAIIGFVAGVFAGQAYPQSNLGELLDKGATKVTKETWKSMLPVKFGGIDFTGRVDFEFTFTDDGKFNGRAYLTRGNGSSGSYGTWTMEESGKQCIDETLPNWSMTWQECWCVYALDGKYYSTQNDSDRSAKALARTLISTKQ
jgi:hypothetical protein